MKVLTIISLLSSILSGGITHNFSGHAENTYYEVNRTYFVDNYESEGTAVGGAVEYTAVYPVTFGMKVNIVFKQPIVSAQIVMEVTAAQNSLYNKWDYIGENCSIEWIDGTHYQIDCYNCSNATFILFASYNQVHNGYGFNRVSVQSSLTSADQWISYNTYFDIVSIQPTYTNNNANIVIDENPDYTNQLSTLLSQTDGIENYLLQIWNSLADNLVDINTTESLIYSRLGTINTNVSNIATYIQTIRTDISSILTSLNRFRDMDEVIAGLYGSIEHEVSNISDIFSGNYLQYQYSDITSSGPQTLYQTVYDLNNDINTDFDIQKLKVVIHFVNADNNGYYYVNVPIYNQESSVINWQYVYVYNKMNRYIYRAIIQTRVNNSKVEVNVQCAQHSLNSNTPASTVTNATAIDFVYITDSSLTVNQKIDEIITSINNMTNNLDDITPDPNEDTLSDFYETLKQNLQLPTVPANDPNILQKMKKITDPVIRMFNLGELDIFKYMFNFGVLAMLFGVIFL